MNTFAYARRAFQEELKLIDPRANPREFNLYAGLAALAAGLDEQVPRMQAQLDRLEAVLQRLSETRSEKP